MQGEFDSAEQARTDPQNFQKIRLEVVRIWHERVDGVWLYLEQAEATSPDKPYRQRVIHLTALPEGRCLSLAFTLKHSARFVGAAQQPHRLSELRMEELEMKQGCGVILMEKEKGIFSGGTAGKDCESSLRGAVYATTTVTLTERTMISWDRGFNAQDGQVWGATKDGYIFLKRPRISGDR